MAWMTPNEGKKERAVKRTPSSIRYAPIRLLAKRSPVSASGYVTGRERQRSRRGRVHEKQELPSFPKMCRTGAQRGPSRQELSTDYTHTHPHISARILRDGDSLQLKIVLYLYIICTSHERSCQTKVFLGMCTRYDPHSHTSCNVPVAL